MATLLHSESRRLYSWWWDSHISPKNSKWLQENLTDMDAKVKAMIKLIEEDADSFARRAEMYYKKRPELMKLVEEFYRAYRALAERYDHATVELRQAHRTMAEAFPNQVPYALADDSPSGSSVTGIEPQTPEMPLPIHALLDPDHFLHKDVLELSSVSLHSLKSNGGFSEESDSGISKRGLKQLNEMFASGDGKIKKGKAHEVFEDRTERAETEVQSLKKTLAEIQAEKEALLHQYQQILQKLSSLESELKDVGGLNERASRAEIEIKILKETLVKLEAERDAVFLQYNNCLERISSLENLISQTQEDAKGLSERAVKAETEVQTLKQELCGLEAEKEAGLFQYNQCLELISSLENKISIVEENARNLNEQTERTETEAEALKLALLKLKEEKEAAEHCYEQCLATIAKMESEISLAQDDVKRLNSEILTGAAKLKSVEEQCSLVERSNQCLRFEAENLAHRIAIKDEELSDKESELEKLQTFVKDEQSRFLQVEATLQNLQKLHSDCQDKHRALTLELENRLQLLKGLEISNHDLQEDLQKVKEENHSLSELNTSSRISISNLQSELFSLKEVKEKLEKDVAFQVAQSDSLQQEICHLKEELAALNRRHRALLEQVHAVGLNPECLHLSVKELQHENLKLKEVFEKDKGEKAVLYEKLTDMNKLLEKNTSLERSLSELSGRFDGSREKVRELQESCQFLQGEKSGLAAEKAILLSQLQIMTENMQKLLEKNALVENTLSGANIELEGLRAKTRSLEELCQMLKNEKTNLLNERSTLVTQLENVEQKLANLELRFTRLEEKCSVLEKEKESTVCQVKELWSYLGLEKQERAHYEQSSQSRVGHLENQVRLLQEERRLGKKEFEEELDKAVNAQLEIFILQKFIEDLEEKNLSLLIECQKHVEASKLSDKVISELETENLEQQVEVEFLLDEIEKLRMEVRQVFRALQFDTANNHEAGIEVGQIPLACILENIEDLKGLLESKEDEKQQFVVENLVLLSLLKQLRLEGAEIESEKQILEQEFKVMMEQSSVLEKEKSELLEINSELRLVVSQVEQQDEALKGQLEVQNLNLTTLQGSFHTLQEENLKVFEEKKFLLEKISELRKEMCILEEENGDIIQEVIALSNLSLVFERHGTEKAEELKALSGDLDYLSGINFDLNKKVENLGEKLELKEEENMQLKDTIKKLQQELHDSKDFNDQLSCQILIGNDFLKQKAMEVLEAEQKLKAICNLNTELCRTIDELKRECEETKIIGENMEKQILELSNESVNQKREIECLTEANGVLESEVDKLHMEIEEQRIREQKLTLELQERSNEFELWEAEASSFYFDLQISSTREVLLENKVHELTTVCKTLEDENARKSIEIEQMNERFGSLEGEIGGLKANLSGYARVIASLEDNIESLENSIFLQTKDFAVHDLEKVVESPNPLQDIDHQEQTDERNSVEADGVSKLLKMQTRIKAIKKALDTLAAYKTAEGETDDIEILESGNPNDKLDVVKAAEQLELAGRSNGGNGLMRAEMETESFFIDDAEVQKHKPEVSEVRNANLMKDIPLDEVCSSYRRSKRENGAQTETRMLELWETAERDCGLDPKSNNTQKEAAAMSENVDECRNFKDANLKRWGSPLELQEEKEVGIDKLELSSNVIQEPKQERNRGRILDGLASDARKLNSLQTTVQELKKKMEGKKGKKANDVELKGVKRQILEMEEAVTQLADSTDHLTKDIEESPSSLEGHASLVSEEAANAHRRRVTEEARKGSEKIGRLQFEVQNIEYMLLKLEDEKKSKGKNRFPGSKTGILLKDFIYSGRTSGRRRKKACFCGCTRPSTRED